MVNATFRPHYLQEGDPVPIVQEVGWAPGPVWTGAENFAHTGTRSRTVQPVEVGKRKKIKVVMLQSARMMLGPLYPAVLLKVSNCLPVDTASRSGRLHSSATHLSASQTSQAFLHCHCQLVNQHGELLSPVPTAIGPVFAKLLVA